MKLTAFTNLAPEDIAYDPDTRTVAIASGSLEWGRLIYPTAEEAALEATGRLSVYEVEADLPDTTVFEVHGDVDQDEGERGAYSAGLFRSFADAFHAAEGLGFQGRRGDIYVRLNGQKIHEDYDSWKARFDKATAVKAPNPAARRELRLLIGLAPHNPDALGVADPEFALYQRLRAKFEPTHTA